MFTYALETVNFEWIRKQHLKRFNYKLLVYIIFSDKISAILKIIFFLLENKTELK